jgi:effector-binding domain-containing protein
MIEPLRIFQTTPQLMAVIPLRIPREDMRKVMGTGLAELRAVAAAQNIAVTGPWFTHHVKNPGENFDFEICLPVAASVTPAGRVQPGEWPAMTIAQTTYHGGYEGLGSAWGEFMAAIKAEGRETVEGLWECYVLGPETSADPAAWRTVLSKPLAM